MVKDYDLLKFTQTPDGTIRAWLFFKEEKVGVIFDNSDFRLLQKLAIWGGYDKREKGLFSWELSKSLAPYIAEKFSKRSNCTIDYHTPEMPPLVTLAKN